MARPEEEWLDRPMSKKDKRMILTLIIAVYAILIMTVTSFRAFNLHVVNFATYYIEFGVHVTQDKINDEQTEFVFIPINIGSLNFGVEDTLSNIKSKTVDKYNAEAVGDGISKQISGKTKSEIMNTMKNGY